MKHLFLIFSIIFFSKFSFSKGNEPIAFPVFKLLKMDSSSYLTHKDLKDSVNTVFVNFSPSCDHCERTIESILLNIQKFSNTQFVLTSFETFSNIRKFYFDKGLNSFTNVFIGYEYDFTLTRQVKYSSFPCLVLFDKNKQYIKTINEESNAKALLKALKIISK